MDPSDRTLFIGGGNMASAIVGGLVAAGRPPASLVVLEPDTQQAVTLRTKFGVTVVCAADASIAGAGSVLWAVKPQTFPDAAAACAPYVAGVLQVSVMAGVRSDTLARAARSERVVRAMPNTPALIGQGIAGLHARPAVDARDRAVAEALLAPTGQLLWLAQESDLDAVTALSGSGPAYVFYFVEALVEAAAAFGLDPHVGRTLALATFKGATALAQASADPLPELRARVTSRGGTTQAAIEVLEARGVKEAIVEAATAARRRAQELGRGRDA